MTAVLVAAASFVGMEAVAYATHRWLMHGPGMRWHRSHHVPPSGRWETNDLFPLCFAALGVAAFAAAALLPLPALRWVGVGMTCYGACYLFVHEIVIHRRVRVRLPDWRYLRWLRESHRVHHLSGCEPYGMLAPLVASSSPSRTAATGSDPLDRATRTARSRL